MIETQDEHHIGSPPAAFQAQPVLNGFAAKAQCADAGRPPRSFHDVCLDLRGRMDTFLAEETESPLLRRVQTQLRVSMGVVDEALARYQSDQISLSYNGGKDCLVLLIIILACLARPQPSSSDKTYPSTSSSEATKALNGSAIPAASASASASATSFLSKFQAVYIVPRHPFPEVDAFVETSGAEYHLDVTRYALPMRKGLETYLADRPSIRAVFVGIRRTDPHGENLTHFDPTDPGWPDFMRVHPVIDWHYVEIWAFLRHFNVPYCSLYDQGYTSLGGTQDTHPNPHLKKQDGLADGFRPAYELMGDDEERLGRDG